MVEKIEGGRLEIIISNLPPIQKRQFRRKLAGMLDDVGEDECLFLLSSPQF